MVVEERIIREKKNEKKGQKGKKLRKSSGKTFLVQMIKGRLRNQWGFVN